MHSKVAWSSQHELTVQQQLYSWLTCFVLSVEIFYSQNNKRTTATHSVRKDSTPRGASSVVLYNTSCYIMHLAKF